MGVVWFVNLTVCQQFRESCFPHINNSVVKALWASLNVSVGPTAGELSRVAGAQSQRIVCDVLGVSRDIAHSAGMAQLSLAVLAICVRDAGPTVPLLLSVRALSDGTLNLITRVAFQARFEPGPKAGSPEPIREEALLATRALDCVLCLGHPVLSRLLWTCIPCRYIYLNRLSCISS